MYEQFLLEIKDSFEYREPNIFYYSDALITEIVRKLTEDEIEIHGEKLLSIVRSNHCIRDEGWMFKKWQERESFKIKRILVELYEHFSTRVNFLCEHLVNKKTFTNL